jgi:HAD superfamily 5'-nucleotidase-like hydrolase
MKRIGWIGFDMDYTLAIYRREELDRLVHGLALERLVTVHGYPAEILEIPFHPGFAIRGLCVDKTTGHLLKLNAHRQIKKAWHGLRPLEQSEIDLYWREVLRLDSRRFMRLDTLFDLPEAYIICAHPGGGWCQHFQTYEAAKKAAEEHRKKGGIHESCRPDSGKCPLH